MYARTIIIRVTPTIRTTFSMVNIAIGLSQPSVFYDETLLKRFGARVAFAKVRVVDTRHSGPVDCRGVLGGVAQTSAVLGSKLDRPRKGALYAITKA